MFYNNNNNPTLFKIKKIILNLLFSTVVKYIYIYIFIFISDNSEMIYHNMQIFKYLILINIEMGLKCY